MKEALLLLVCLTIGTLMGVLCSSRLSPPAPSPGADSLAGVSIDAGQVFVTDSTVTVVWRRVP